MQFLITGGPGFSGSHLADDLLERGHGAHVLDDLSTGSIENIRHLKNRPGFGYTIESAASVSIAAELVDEADVVYHLAAAVGVELIVESPVHTIETNVHCTEVILMQANKKKKPVFIASTSEVYGKGKELPFREDGDLLLGPTDKRRWAYAYSKALDEYLGLAYFKGSSCRSSSAVCSTLSGHDKRVVMGWWCRALFARHSPASRLRSTVMERSVDASVTLRTWSGALADLMTRGDLYGEVFNIGSQEEISILDLSHRVREAADSESDVSLIPYEDAYTMSLALKICRRRVPDLSKVERFLGWHPTRDLPKILDDVIRSEREGGIEFPSLGSADLASTAVEGSELG